MTEFINERTSTTKPEADATRPLFRLACSEDNDEVCGVDLGKLRGTGTLAGEAAAGLSGPATVGQSADQTSTPLPATDPGTLHLFRREDLPDIYTKDTPDTPRYSEQNPPPYSEQDRPPNPQYSGEYPPDVPPPDVYPGQGLGLPRELAPFAGLALSLGLFGRGRDWDDDRSWQYGRRDWDDDRSWRYGRRDWDDDRSWRDRRQFFGQPMSPYPYDDDSYPYDWDNRSMIGPGIIYGGRQQRRFDRSYEQSPNSQLYTTIPNGRMPPGYATTPQFDQHNRRIGPRDENQRNTPATPMPDTGQLPYVTTPRNNIRPNTAAPPRVDQILPGRPLTAQPNMGERHQVAPMAAPPSVVRRVEPPAPPAVPKRIDPAQLQHPEQAKRKP